MDQDNIEVIFTVKGKKFVSRITFIEDMGFTKAWVLLQEQVLRSLMGEIIEFLRKEKTPKK